ncbi:hypothetical protein D3C75_672400 [compost metagenome]
MRHRCLGQIEHGENIGTERPLQLLRGDILNLVLRMLLGGIVDQDVEFAQTFHRFVDQILAECLHPDVTGNQNTLPALLLHLSFGLFGIGMLIQIRNDHIRTFLGKMNGNCTPDAAVASCNESRLAQQLACRFIA